MHHDRRSQRIEGHRGPIDCRAIQHIAVGRIGRVDSNLDVVDAWRRIAARIAGAKVDESGWNEELLVLPLTVGAYEIADEGAVDP